MKKMKNPISSRSNLLDKCPVCGKTPALEYACGEYFIAGEESCRFCGNFTEMHSSPTQEIFVWNEAAKEERKFECPLGGDETNDCEGCFYSGDYHFVEGECIRRST